MWHGVDATAIHQQPSRNHNPGIALFFVMFLVIGSLFILNLFVAVVIDTFYQEKEKLSRNNDLTQTQQDYCDILIKCYKAFPTKEHVASGSKIREWCYNRAKSKQFDMFILVCIILNTFCLALSWYGRPEKVTLILGVLNYIFTVIYTVECVIKIAAFRKDYFTDGWNIFDFIIVLSAWSGIIAL